MEMWYAFFAACAVMLMSFVGVLFTVGRIGAWMQKYLTYLATFSGGVFLLIAYHLAEEAVHEGGWIVGIGSVLLGAAIMESIHYLFPLDHHHHEHEESHIHTPIDGRKVLASDALHNIGDGILLVGAFSSNVYVGLAATVGVLLHEVVQEISEYFIFRESGLTNIQALLRNFAVSTTILIGFIFATFISWGPLVAILSGFAAGGFISVILHDLLPHALASVRAHGGGYVHGIAALLGASTMFALQTVLPHDAEIHEEEFPHAEELVATDQGGMNIRPEPSPLPSAHPDTPTATRPATSTPGSVADTNTTMLEPQSIEADFIPPAETAGTRN